MPVKKGGKKSRTITLEMAGVSSGGGRAVPDGNYTLEVDEVTEEESSEGNPYLKFVYKISDGALKGAKVWDNCSLQPQALWRLKTLLECFEVEVPDSSMDLDLDDLVGKSVDAEITNETYQGKTRPKITGFLGVGGSKAEEETEEEEKPTKSKYKVGQSVGFKDEKGKKLKGTITAVSGTDVTVDVKGEEWDLSQSDLIDF